MRERALAAGEGRGARIARRHRIGERMLSGWLKVVREAGRRVPEPHGCGPSPVGGKR